MPAFISQSKLIGQGGPICVRLDSSQAALFFRDRPLPVDRGQALAFVALRRVVHNYGHPLVCAL
jgi:hypothetical protein